MTEAAEELDGGGAEPLHPSRPSLCCKTFIIHHFLVVVVNEVGLGADKLSLRLFLLSSFSLRPHSSKHSALLIVSKRIVPSARLPRGAGSCSCGGKLSLLFIYLEPLL